MHNFVLLSLFSVLFYFVFEVTCESSESFSATSCVKEFALREGDLISAFARCIENSVDESPAVSRVTRLIDAIKEKIVPDRSPEEVHEYVTHPVNALNLLRRWQLLNTATKGNPTFSACRSWALTTSLPSVDEIHSTVASILRLQRIYKVDTTDLRRGYIKGFQAVETISDDDCYMFGQIAFAREDYGLAAQWLSFAVKGTNVEFSMKEAIQLLARAHEAIGDLPAAIEVIEDSIDSGMAVDELETLALTYRRRFQDSLKADRPVSINMTTWTPPIEIYKIWTDYTALCRGDMGNDRYISPRHYCTYKPGKLGYVRYKQEIIHTNPTIALFYDVISDADAETIKALARPRLIRSLIGDPDSAIVSKERVSKLTWLFDRDSKMIRKLGLRVGDATGLETTMRERLSSSEAFQVLNYGIGGQYEMHFDVYLTETAEKAMPPYLRGTGDRVATFIFYLSEVPLGGSSVFPAAGVRVPVVKNAAGFWFNLKRSGRLEKKSLHAGCPVLVGSKWVTNKWIRQWGQEFRRPCGLTLNAREQNTY